MNKECTGPFGLCSQEDKIKLGYIAIKKLHEKMDDDRDGQVEIQETKEVKRLSLFYRYFKMEFALILNFIKLKVHG